MSYFDKGIYHVVGDVFAMQIIVVSQLSMQENFWLRNLTNDIRDSETVRQIATEYQKHRGNRLYRSVMNIIIRANEAMFKEESIMCEAIIDLFREEYDAGIKVATEDALQRGALQQLVELVRDNVLSMEEAVKRTKVSRDEFVALLNQA